MKVYPNRWNTVGSGVLGLLSGLGICLVALVGGPRSYVLGGLAVALLSLAVLAVARRPWIVVDGEGVWAFAVGRVLYDEIESVAAYKWMGYRGVKIRLRPDSIRKASRSILARLSMLLSRPFWGRNVVILRCEGCSVSADDVVKEIQRRLAVERREATWARVGFRSPH